MIAIPARSLLCLLAALSTGCSAVYDVQIDVTIDDAVLVAEGDALVLVATDYAPSAPDSANEDAPWRLGGDVMFLTADQRRLQGLTGVCCAPEPTIHVYAFLDRNGNGRYDAGEPFGADPRNPIAIDDDYRTQISILPVAD